MDTNFLIPGTIAIGLVMAALGWYHWRRVHPQSTSPHLTRDGFQVIEVLVRDGYHPAKVRLRAGQPTRLIFRRDEDDPCSAGIYLTEPSLRRHLPAFSATTITFTPEKSGSHLFTCEEGRHRGYLIVEPSSRSRRIEFTSRLLLGNRESHPRLRPVSGSPQRPPTHLRKTANICRLGRGDSHAQGL